MSTTWLWPILIGYGALMFLISPTATRFGEFFASRRDGRDIGMGMLVSSVVISWIFAKSITNASNLGASYGFVGAVAYAGWYLSIPVAGVVIYALRTKLRVDSLAGFLTTKYGRGATLAFMLVILLRLTNEVWSNTAVVGAYFGASGSMPYFTAAMLFAALTLFYSLRGGLRSSIVTDLLQFGLGVFLLVFVLALIVPKSGAGTLLTSGSWTFRGGVDLLLVALLQSFSYPFHDPVLTDRAFITRPLVMLKGYLIAGVIAAAFIALFGLTGVHAKLFALDVGQDAPLRVANAFGVATLTIMTVLMMVSAGSTLDSTLSSFSRAVVMDVGGRQLDGGTGTGLTRGIQRRLAHVDPLRVGRIAMILAVLVGSAPLFAGAAIIKATTVSGTMVLGLAPAFLLFAWARARTWAFHLGFWPGVLVGTLYAIGRVPASWALGDGPYASLLGANVAGTLLVGLGFLAGAWLDGVRHPRRAAAGLLLGVLIAGVPLNGARADEETGKLRFSGQTMFRLTLKLRDFDRPAAELYNLRLIAERSVHPFHYVAEVRFRQTPLRAFSPSNTWIQQAYVAWTVTPELTLSGGLIYNQLGLFWDGSWFGNLPYLNGHKLDPDMNVEAKWQRPAASGTPGITAWLQLSPAEDGLNGTFFTSGKVDRLRLPPISRRRRTTARDPPCGHASSPFCVSGRSPWSPAPRSNMPRTIGRRATRRARTGSSARS